MEGEQNDATTDGELVSAMTPVEKRLFIFAFVILVASIAAASVFFSLDDAGKKEAQKRSDSMKEPVTPTAPAQSQETAN